MGSGGDWLRSGSLFGVVSVDIDRVPARWDLQDVWRSRDRHCASATRRPGQMLERCQRKYRRPERLSVSKTR